MIAKTLTLPISCEAAFDLFTRRIDDWWPPDRRHLPAPSSLIALEPSGRFFERAPDGREFDLGRVREFDPPLRLVLDFFVATGADRPTEVEIRFAAVDGGSRISIAHRPTPASAEIWPTQAERYAQSWQAVLEALARSLD
jgi:uncharacterized protein YndB with AHSA1/START domain